MDLSALVPVTHYAIASVISIGALRLRKRARIAALAPVCLFSLLSLNAASNISWPMGGDSTFSNLIVYFIPYIIKLLAFDEHAVSPELSSRPWNFVNYYRTWNNLRKTPVRLSPMDRSAPVSHQERLTFVSYQASKAAALWIVNGYVSKKLLFKTFTGVTASDFSPEMELLNEGRVLHLTFHQLRMRAFISVQWMWSAYFFLEFYYCLLNILFAGILALDRPEDLTSLFGSPFHATSVRGFWGRFWQRINIPMFSFYSSLIARKILGLKPGSRMEKTVRIMLIFIMSGLSHCLVGWSLGDTALSRIVLFFMASFSACALEVVVSKSKVLGASKEPRSTLFKAVRKMAGFAWVYFFFFSVTPLWIYPKVYPTLVGLI